MSEVATIRRPNLSTPQAKAAQQYMTHKGIDTQPYAVEQLEGQDVWYFYYDLSDGKLELEVYYDWDAGEWHTQVTTFRAAG